ncbi:uncharacterized protein C3orf85 homolog isoform X2 [Columba livia]|uniref:uncharacterized protein C3orf85 homolog isoform X2 n=1 Tax=Columba livia TaxID=8932 RepID=UPI0031BAC8F6
MSLKMFQILVSALLFTGVLGAPFLTEESANQFIRLKRQIPYSLNYWDPSSSQNTWGYSMAEQVSETWKALKDTAQYYMDLGSSAFNPSIASIIAARNIFPRRASSFENYMRKLKSFFLQDDVSHESHSSMQHLMKPKS